MRSQKRLDAAEAAAAEAAAEAEERRRQADAAAAAADGAQAELRATAHKLQASAQSMTRGLWHAVVDTSVERTRLAQNH